MKEYSVVFKLFGKPGLGHEIIQAGNKNHAKIRFKELNIKYDKIIRVVTL